MDSGSGLLKLELLSFQFQITKSSEQAPDGAHTAGMDYPLFRFFQLGLVVNSIYHSSHVD
jgi:hypothetical protein